MKVKVKHCNGQILLNRTDNRMRVNDCQQRARMVKRKGRQSEITQTLIHSNEDQDEFRDRRSEDSEENQESGFFACYLLTSLCPRYKGHTYIGFTVNPRRRIRQHNGELCSGASRTKKKRPWEMVLCIYGFPTNVAALQFEWAWQHPVESLAVRKAAVFFKSLGGLANKIKLAYTMLTLPTWNNLNLTVNFFSTKYTKHYAGCPTLPSHMRVQIRSMDELPCYTEGYKEDEDEDDMFRCDNDLCDEEEPEKTCEDVTIPVLHSADHHENEKEASSVSDTENNEQTFPTYELRVDDTDPEKTCEDVTIPVLYSADHHENEKEASSVSDTENDEQTFHTYELRVDDDTEPENTGHQNNEDKAIFVSDDENNEEPFCSTYSPGRLFSKRPKGLFMDSDYFSVVSPTIVDGKGKTDSVRDKDGPETNISGSSSRVEVIDLFTPSPKYRSNSRKKKRGVSDVCPEIIDLTESPICV